jgi:transcriptional regulator with XRE-family HTH domain
MKMEVAVMKAKYIGERITELRLKMEVSEYQMSYDLGHNKNYIRAITSGRSLPSVTGLFDIIDYFGLTPSEFFDTDYWNDMSEDL